MGRAPCCDKASVKKGPWSPEEDAKLKEFIDKFGTGGNWIALPHKAGLKRCGKSCRLRWLNYLRPNIKHGEFSDDEDRIICTLFASIGSRWSIIAAQLPGRTDNDIKNYWNTKLKKKLLAMAAIHPSSSSSSLSSLISATHKKPFNYSYQSPQAPLTTAATHLSTAANYKFSSLIHDHQDNNHNYFNFNNYSNYNSTINPPPPMPISMPMQMPMNNNTLLHGAYNNWCNFNSPSPSPLLGFQYSQEYNSSSLQYNIPMQQHECAGGMLKFGAQHEAAAAAAATTSSNNSDGSCISYGKHEKKCCKQEDDHIALPEGAGFAVLGFGDQGYNQGCFNMMGDRGSGEKPKGYNGNTAMTATTTPLLLQDELDEIKQMVISSSFMFNDEINKTVDDKDVYFSYYN